MRNTSSCIGCDNNIRGSYQLRFKVADSKDVPDDLQVFDDEDPRPHNIQTDKGKIDICPDCFEDAKIEFDIVFKNN